MTNTWHTTTACRDALQRVGLMLAPPLLLVVLAFGCEEGRGHQDAPARSAEPTVAADDEKRGGPADPPAVEAEPADAAAPTPPTSEKPEPSPAESSPPTPADPGEALASIERLVERAEFREAYQAARALQREFRDHPRSREIDKLVARMSRLNRQARGLDLLIDKLDAPDARIRELARRRISQAGEVGDIALRQVVRTRADKTAVAAAEILIEISDRRAGPLFARRLAEGVGGALRTTLIEGLPRVAPEADRRVLRSLYPMIQGEAAYEHRAIAGYVIDVTAEAAGQDPAEWAEWLGAEDALETIRGVLRNAMMKTDSPDLMAWAADHAVAMNIVRPGLKAEFFKGSNFEEKIGSRLVERINVSHNEHRIEGVPTSSISARWTGRLLVPREGQYTLYASSDDGVRLWVDGELRIDHWRGRAEAENATRVTLTPGLHALRVEWFQGSGSYACRLRWAGPGIDKQLIGPAHLRVVPWSGMDQDLED